MVLTLVFISVGMMVAQPSCPEVAQEDVWPVVDLGSGPGLLHSVSPGGHEASIDDVAHVPLSDDIALRQHSSHLMEQQLIHVASTLVNTAYGPVSITDPMVLHWQFFNDDRQDDGRYSMLEHRDDHWYGSTYWTGPNWTRVGKDWHHPGEHTPSVRCFTAPRDGVVTVTGQVYKADTNNGGGDGVRLAIRHGRKNVWQAEIDGDDAEGVAPELSLTVKEGDKIRFVVHKRGKISYDTTHWDPVITYATGERYVASEGFSTKEQGAYGWSYGMEVEAAAHANLPVLRILGRDTVLKEQRLEHGTPTECIYRGNDGGVLPPLILISDRQDRSGIAISLSDAMPWRCKAVMDEYGIMDVMVYAGTGDTPFDLRARESLALPPLAVFAYEGNWLNGVAAVQEFLESTPDVVTGKWLHQNFSSRHAVVQDFLFWAMVQSDWKRQDGVLASVEAYAAATKIQLEKTTELLDALCRDWGDTFLATERAECEYLSGLIEGATTLDAWENAYLRVRNLKRRIALNNPLMDFGPMLFCKRVPTSYSHLVMQYYGWRARPGGGLFLLEAPGHSLAARDILAGRLEGGNVLEPRLSYDGKRIVFSYVTCSGKTLDIPALNNEVDEDFYHIWEVNVDGSGLRQLTSGPYDDLMPTYLPDGGIAFSSTRRKGYARCFGAQFSKRWHVYTLHRMDGDGSNLKTLSYHDTNEWFPMVSHGGRILYSRWDYIDRDAVTHQNLWATSPQGANPVAVWGNATETPHCTFQAQPIPGSNKLVFTASAHHSITGGSIALLDPTRGVDGLQAITRITPEIAFPEAEGRDIQEYYAAPWPLSEEYFLVAYSPTPLVWEPGANKKNALGLYLLDAAGNRELIYRDPEIGSTNPRPLVALPTPPVVTSTILADADTVDTGEMLLMDVYQGLGDAIPRGAIKALRVIQIFPKTTNVADSPPVGMAREENGRAVLGTVPVEADGSARFKVPARKPLLFQVLDENGDAYQTMRTITYVQPGEKVSCIGCHENRMTAGNIPAKSHVLAMRRPASEITPGPFEGEPFSFMRVVQPVLDKHCAECHSGDEAKKGIQLTRVPVKNFSQSYVSLCGDVNFWGEGTNLENASEALVPRFGGRNQLQITPPGGMYGARGSRLMKMLRAGHGDVELSDAELRRLAMWIDCNAIFYGLNTPEEQRRQFSGEMLPMPLIQ